ncbi:ABC transporter ATP-binding protein [Nocardiopsis mangrovi]|uniref:ABC transporter ATP-binding protein n=1 Tax=Nocardiopsis mangrovi TaxID=1179818 RepID=A0ABV9DQW8_9ACTN
MRLELADITKTHPGGKRAADRVSMEIGPGVLGLLGPNGAGKSTLMRVLATVTRPTSGRVTWNGTDIVARPAALRRVLGYLPQDFGVYPDLSAREFLGYLAAVKGLTGRSARARVEELMRLVNLQEAGNRPLGAYSGGMRQRVGIAQALLNDPWLLIVDEPTVGLDPEERMRFRNLLGELAHDRIVILSTHIVSDVEAVAEDIAVLADGRLVRRGAPEELLRAVDGRVWEATVPAHALAGLRSRHLVGRVARSAEGVRARILSDAPPAPDAVRIRPDLEDAYLHAVRSAAASAAGRDGGRAAPAAGTLR